MTTDFQLAGIVFVGEKQGAHVHVTVLGPGPKGNRPLCGRFAISDRDWDRLLAQLPPNPADDVFADPLAPLMWCCFRRSMVKDLAPEPGSLVLVEVPSNCTIHDEDAARLLSLVALAKEIGDHWRQQEGVNGALLDRLAELTR